MATRRDDCAAGDFRSCRRRLAAAAVYFFGKATPTGFLPEEDQGAFFVEVRLPDGATLGRTSTATAEVEDILRGMPAISDVTTVLGYSMLNGLAQSNSAFMIALLKPFAEREDPSMQVNALLNSVRRQTIGMRQAVVVPFNLPAIIGLSTTGGFEYQLQDLEGRTPQDLAATMRGLIVTANQQPELSNVYSTFSTDTPMIYLNIDRDKAQTLGVLPSDIFQALQASLGGYYVNDFNIFGRTWQVIIQAEEADRNDISDIYRINVRNASGTMVPIRALAEAEMRLGPAAINRYNNYRSVTINGSPAPGRSGEAIAGHGKDLGDAAGGLCLPMVRHRPAGEGSRRPDDLHSRARGVVCLPLPRRSLRELFDPDRRSLVRHRRTGRRDVLPVAVSDGRTTSTRRSASSS